MIITRTLNPAVDQTVVVDRLRIGEVNRFRAPQLDPAGKGTNASRMVQSSIQTAHHFAWGGGGAISIKPNLAKAEWLLGRPLPNIEASAKGATDLVGRGIAVVVISMGALGALCARGDRVWRAIPPKVEQRSAVGSGGCGAQPQPFQSVVSTGKPYRQPRRRVRHGEDAGMLFVRSFRRWQSKS